MKGRYSWAARLSDCTKRFGGYPILRDPAKIRRKAGLLAEHYFQHGALIGLNLAADPNDGRKERPLALAIGALAFIGLAAMALAGPRILAFPAALLLAYPAWVYAAVDMRETVFENRAYLASLALALAIGAAAAAGNGWTLAFIGLLLAAWIAATQRRTRVWRSKLAFAEAALADDPKSLRARTLAASAWRASGQPGRAIEAYEAVMAEGLNEPSAAEGALAAYNLAVIYKELAIPAPEDASSGYIRRAMEILTIANERWPGNALILLERGRLYMAFALWESAVGELTAAIAARPNLSEAWRMRAACLGQMAHGDPEIIERVRADVRQVEILEGVRGQLNVGARPEEAIFIAAAAE